MTFKSRPKVHLKGVKEIGSMCGTVLMGIWLLFKRVGMWRRGTCEDLLLALTLLYEGGVKTQPDKGEKMGSPLLHSSDFPALKRENSESFAKGREPACV